MCILLRLKVPSVSDAVTLDSSGSDEWCSDKKRAISKRISAKQMPMTCSWTTASQHQKLTGLSGLAAKNLQDVSNPMTTTTVLQPFSRTTQYQQPKIDTSINIPSVLLISPAPFNANQCIFIIYLHTLLISLFYWFETHMLNCFFLKEPEELLLFFFSSVYRVWQ